MNLLVQPSIPDSSSGGVPHVLSIAGSDSGGGAGIQADLKTFSAFRAYGLTVVTALTAQNTRGVSAIFQTPPSFLEAQLEAVFSDIRVDAVKTGMIGEAAAVLVVARALRAAKVRHLVVDPVMVAKGGHRLLKPDAVEAVRLELLPLASLITPNLDEVGELLGAIPRSISEMEAAARALHRLGPGAVLIKGGHLVSSSAAVDVLFDGEAVHHFTAPRMAAVHTHGTGCTLSAAIAASLARGEDLVSAVHSAKTYLTGALRTAFPVGHGIGPVNHLFSPDFQHEEALGAPSPQTKEDIMGRPPLKKEAIERSALELFVEKGVDGTSIRDISLRAGVTEGALYRHHKSKDDLVRALFHVSYEGFAKMVRESQSEGLPLRDQLRNLISVFYAFYDKDPFVCRFVMITRHHLLDEVRGDDKNPVELVARMIRSAQAKGEIPTQDAELSTQLIIGMVLQATIGNQYGRLTGPMSNHSEAIARACLAIVYNPEGYTG